MRTVALTLVTGALLAPAAAAAQQEPDQPPSLSTYVFDCAGEPTAGPRSFVLTCGDANQALMRMRWRDWDTPRAVGTGWARVNTCEPSCAEGKSRRYRVRAVVDRRLKGRSDDFDVYRRLTVTAVGPRPEGVPARQVFRLTRRGPKAL